MEVLNLNLDKYLSTTEYDPSPNRIQAQQTTVSNRTLLLIYSCENCDYEITIKTKDFEKHTKTFNTNLHPNEKKIFDDFMKSNNINHSSFIDFYCPVCKQATTIVFIGGPSGYWGEFGYKITNLLIVKI
jgi:hypothetical protein